MTIPELKELIEKVKVARRELAELEQPIQDMLELFERHVRKEWSALPPGQPNISESHFNDKGINVCFVSIDEVSGYYPIHNWMWFKFEHILDPEAFVKWTKE